MTYYLGDTLIVVPSEDLANSLVKKRIAAWDLRQQRLQYRDKRGGSAREGKSLAVIVKSDVFGMQLHYRDVSFDCSVISTSC